MNWLEHFADSHPILALLAALLVLEWSGSIIIEVIKVFQMWAKR